MDLSVIIPVYNVERYVEKCILSIMNQTYTHSVECIIVDDATPDDSMNIVKRLLLNYRGEIEFKLLYHKSNRGLAAARNTGLNLARGKYIISIDSDDYCESNMLEVMYEKALLLDADIVVADYWRTYENKEIYFTQNIPKSKVKCLKQLLDGKLFTVNWNKLIRKELYNLSQVSYLEGIDYGEDMRVCFYLFSVASKIVHVPKAFVHYVQYNSNAYNNILSQKSLEDYIVNIIEVEAALRKYGYYDVCQNELFRKQVRLKLKLLLQSKGVLQHKWNKLFKQANRCLFSAHISLFWTSGLIFASVNQLYLFNLLRGIWMLIKQRKIVIYQ